MQMSDDQNTELLQYPKTMNSGLWDEVEDQRIIPNQGETNEMRSDHLSVSDDALGVYMFKVFVDSRKLRIGIQETWLLVGVQETMN